MERISRDKVQPLLEQMIDQFGVRSILKLIVDICYAKSDHILANWNDKPLAKIWERAGQSIDMLSDQSRLKHLP